jgi:NagD protein
MKDIWKKNFLIDMDGVLIQGKRLIPGADLFIQTLKEKKIPFLVLTNNSLYTQKDLSYRLSTFGLEIPSEQIFTSAMATANFIQSQVPDGTAFVIGESGLTEAIHQVGYVVTDNNPDYVVLGETFTYHYEHITKGIRLIMDGALFIGTNPDTTGPTDKGVSPATGAMAALMQSASGKAPFFVGKPNPFMMRSALNYLGAHSESTIMMGDRMDTDIIAGTESGMDTILVLSGVTSQESIETYPYRPKYVVPSVADLLKFL